MTLHQHLPGPTAELWEWQLFGACRGAESEVFYHPEGERGRARLQRERRAKAICHTCPVLLECRRHALETQEPYGVWGGLGENERHALIRGI
ncbi:WhiB family transcriptional regulator [Corynebacterium poyangense]|uniref:Transcriptional regulator WhiB n=1 Tax=Corynebacterium poyangense TaxID=2684405 RepID=A0A7H0SMA4_9CORY|nr:WhiB family transcriptional regulator [Corynebacterium poyangense]MBZ8176779.1 WhiB family transcriptional regulator [Corynebacterium poyangense]QNQ89679.1 WhiB family transcriptional regulator [Corynebacterium poyangense]